MAIFSNAKVRQFALQNGDGSTLNLTTKNIGLFLNEPTNLGYTNNLQVQRLGNAENVVSKKYSMPQPRGTLIFHKNTNSGKYEDYYNFVRFISKKPLTLWYYIPTTNNNTFHLPVEEVSLDKSEVGVDGTLRCNISFYGLKLWLSSQQSSQRTDSSVTVVNNGDTECGIEIEVKRSNNGAFKNPKILFKQNNVEYGELAITSPLISTGYNKLILNSKDGEQSIKLYQGSSLVANPFAYIDFSRADGVKQFPFPKLKQGTTEIEFTYTGSSFSPDKTYTLNYDEEFISV